MTRGIEIHPFSLENETTHGFFSVGVFLPGKPIYNTPEAVKAVGVKRVYISGQETQKTMLEKALRDAHSFQTAPLGYVGIATSYPDNTNLLSCIEGAEDLDDNHKNHIYVGQAGMGKLFKVIKDNEQQLRLDGKEIILGATEVPLVLNPETFDQAIFTAGAVVVRGLIYNKNFRILSAVFKELLDPKGKQGIISMPINDDLKVKPYIDEPIYYSGGEFFDMDGSVVWRILRRGLLALFEDALRQANKDYKDIDAVIFHQGSGRTNEAMVKTFPDLVSKMIFDIDDGNLGAGSTLKPLKQIDFTKKDVTTIAFVPYGAGLKGLYGSAAIVQIGKVA